ncbi:Tol-Pal system beta propeller repeat protein TolB [Polynucleobacter sp. MWH-Berg-3C6]|uniref:Tol-Pal system beta propeller repeat protein TolB n=1 Tax=Polynucleobacter sp. MWH-Berg-3C6 TaxID=1855882 RepID=UPI001C0E820C|nr:Tol-Pal system beta propeller repeat protein TolB [Polynucleobacter sp. MWH-Berg-3C6]MBU3549867.1 Tol-Pal system protein TolB [Polynucleobacter sp. MWH-Berg-3C6]
MLQLMKRIVLKSQLLIAAVSAVLIGASTPAVAQMNIEITGVGQSLYPIAVMRFKDEQKLPVNITEIIRQDLARSGYFKNTENGNVVESDEGTPNYKSWAARGADALVVGSVVQSGGTQFEIQYKLFDIRKSESLGGLKLNSSADNLRAVAHKIADDIILKLLGERGVFSTRLSYVIKDGKRYRLVISDADGQNIRNAMNSGEPIISPSWSPDGKKVAYVSFEDRKPVIYVHELATGRRIALSNQKGNNSAPAWSPDGRKLAISLSKDGNTQIYSINADGTGLQRLTRGYTIDTEPQYSADGRYIYFTSDRGGNPQIYRMSAEGEQAEGVKRITFKQGFVTSPRISPDGKYLAYIANIGGAYRLYLLNLATGDAQALTDGTSDESPSFAANGRYVLYSTKVNGKRVLAAVSVDGNSKQVLSIPGSDVRQPSWGPFMD